MLNVLLEPAPALGVAAGGALPHPVLVVTLLLALMSKELIGPQAARAALVVNRVLNVVIVPLVALFVLNLL